MFNVYVEMPRVNWCTVAGARSRGFEMKELKTAMKFHGSICRQLRELGYHGAFAVTTLSGEEFLRTRVPRLRYINDVDIP